jgi:hypothetical protein
VQNSRNSAIQQAMLSRKLHYGIRQRMSAHKLGRITARSIITPFLFTESSGGVDVTAT